MLRAVMNVGCVTPRGYDSSHTRGPAALAVLLAGGLLCAGSPALAGRSHYGWLDGTEVVPERGVELETWLQELDNVGPLARDESALWWAAVVGLTDQLELALPLELSWQRAGAVPGTTQLDRWGAEARYRFVSSDPVEAPPWVPMLRVALKREIDERKAVLAEVEASLSYQRGCWHAQANLGAKHLFRSGEDSLVLRPALGVSAAVWGELRLGAEGIASLAAHGAGVDWVAAGPNLAFTHGRFWLAASLPIGLSEIDAAPRVRWGIAF